jgi:hypothetical protein
MRLSELLYDSGRAALALQAADGSFPAGRNGPYADRETPVRNTAHWLITMLHVHALSGEPAFQDAAARAAAYLAADAARPMGATFLCRTLPERDFCNGLIGQAWVIEALAAATERLGEPRYGDLARAVFLLHPFDEAVGLWRCVNVEGSYGPFDMTFNHQLWFAASGALLEPDPQGEVGARVARFLDRTLETHLKVDPSGRIAHFVPSPRRRGMPLRLLARALQPLRRLRRSPAMVRKEIGYHAFNLYAFALLRGALPGHALWRSPKLLAALRFVSTPEYVRGLEDNPFGYPYNPPGFEVAFAAQTFADVWAGGQPGSWWVGQQLQRTYDPQTRLLGRQTSDQHTLAARLYEATRLADMAIVAETGLWHYGGSPQISGEALSEVVPHP